MTVEKIRNNGETKLIMKLVAGNGVEKFKWADWVDVAMEYMREADSVITDKNELNWRKGNPSKCDLT